MSRSLPIGFDPAKRRENLAKHNLDFRGVGEVFEGPFIERPDDRFAYGEARWIALGPVASLEDRVCVVIYTLRDGARRIISYRKANPREQRTYREAIARNGG